MLHIKISNTENFGDRVYGCEAEDSSESKLIKSIKNNDSLSNL